MEDSLLDSTILEIVRTYPGTQEVFTSNGFELFGAEDALRELGAVLKLKTALRTKKIAADAFLRLLRDKITDAADYDSLLPSLVVNRPGNFNFVAQLPCGLKVPLERELQSVLQKIQEELNTPLNYYTGSCCNDLLNLNECIPHYRDIDEVPDLVLTKGYHFLQKNFTDRFVKTGLYAPPPNQPLNKQIAGVDILDRDGGYHVISLTATVMVVDRRRLGSLPAPRTWGDLLKPEYERKVVMNSYGDSFSDVVLLNIYKEYGEAGIESLGRAIHSGSHAAQMIKGITGSKPDVPPIYIMADFFAHTISAGPDIQIIWPEDGALVMPVYFMVKAEKARELKTLTDFLTSPQVGKLCADAYFPSVHPEAQNKLPAGAKFKWLGWDYIKTHDLEDLVEKLNNRCMASFRGYERCAEIPPAAQGGLAAGEA